MKLSTKILFIIYIVFTVGALLLGPSMFRGINISASEVTFDFDAAGIICLVLNGVNSVIGFILYTKFLRNLSLSKGLFFATVPMTLTFAVLMYFVATLNTYTAPAVQFVRNTLLVTPTNNNNLLWAIVLFAAYLIFLFVTFIFMTKPLNKVQRTVARLSDGSVKDDISVGGNRQFKDIEHSLNKINYNYKEKENQIRQVNLESEKFIPKQFLKFLGKSSIAELELGHQVQREVTTMFCDIKSSTAVSRTLSLEENFNFINSYLNVVSPIVRRYGGFIDKYLGDGILAVFSDAESSLECAGAIVKAIQLKNNTEKDLPNIDARIGINTGEVIFGIVGDEERKSPTIISEAVNLASKLEEINKVMGTVVTFSKRTLNSLRTNYAVSYRYIGSLILDDKSEISVFESLDVYRKDKREKLTMNKVRFEEAVRFYSSNEYRRAKEIFEALLKEVREDDVAYVYYNKAIEKLENQKG